MSGMEKKLDLADKKVDTIGQKSRRARSFTEQQYNRQRRGNMSEATPERTSGPRDLHEQDARVASPDGRFGLTWRRWQASRSGSDVTLEPSDSQSYWLHGQGSEVKPRPDGREFDTNELGELKGSGRTEETSSQQPETRRQVARAVNRDINNYEGHAYDEFTHGKMSEDHYKQIVNRAEKASQHLDNWYKDAYKNRWQPSAPWKSQK
jgi:hypothetical protein